ncbi:polyhydroxyalkanoic acid synthase [Lysobacter pythonis]|uniref:Polyhydroxyalkanoic acid synthase n=1 Tax=Solilutibacter pythonis TaxID=2483112 RepID=A0A3M2HYV0_9GAMM|nr:polyhydroxyalkanoic acid system family protein [Lysobacter pythonis]RMH94906.1 polyhydroxyalkanoic acid synthase [Lysobacter pythonis]
MADLDILHPTALGMSEARLAVEGVARTLRERFGIESAWEGDELRLQHGGVDGRIALSPGRAQVNAQLGFPYSAMQGMIETEIRRVLAEKLG